MFFKKKNTAEDYSAKIDKIIILQDELLVLKKTYEALIKSLKEKHKEADEILKILKENK